MSDQTLWAAVLQQAIDDVIRPDGTAVRKYWMQQHGIGWFSPKNRDFVEVCWLAGLDPEAVFERFEKMLDGVVLLELPPEEVEKQRRRDQIKAIAEAQAAEREKRQAEIQSIREQQAIEQASRPVKAPTPSKAPKPSRTVELHTAFGEERTMQEWATIAGINARALRARIARGKTLEDAITAPSDQGHPGIRRNDRFTLDGQTRTLAEWADLASMPTKTLARRIKDGWLLDKALLGGSYTKAAYPGKTFTAFGQTHTAYQWAKLLGMSEGTIAGRLRKGWPIELALTTPTQRRRTHNRGEGASQDEIGLHRAPCIAHDPA